MHLSSRDPAGPTWPLRLATRLINTWERIAASIDSTYARSPLFRRVGGALMISAGFVFLIYAVHGQVLDLSAAGASISTSTYAALILLSMLTALITASLHAEILASTTSQTSIDRHLVRYAYAASQVARYVPGKVFGVMLEAQILSPSQGISQVITATLLQTILVYTWAGTASVAILGALWLDSAWVLLLTPAALFLIWTAQRNRLIERASGFIVARTASPSTPSTSIKPCPQSAWRSTSLLALQWIPFFAMWILITGTDQGTTNAFWLGGSYLLASIIGSLLVFAPSGLVVREAAFIWMGGLQGLPASSLITWAIIMRVVLTFADVLAIPLLWIALQLRRRY